MPKITKPLSNTEISAAKATVKQYSLADGEGLYLRIATSGTKTWLFNYYRPHTKKRANLSFGNYPSVMLADARSMRTNARSLLAKGIDPQTSKAQNDRSKKDEALTTLEAVAAAWLEVKRHRVSSDHARDIWRSLELHIFGSIGNIPISAVTAPIAIEALKPLAAKGSLEQVKRVCQRLNEVMVWATNTGVVQHNPLAGIAVAFKLPEKQNQPTLQPSELPLLLSAIQNASIKLTTRSLILWQLHTMTRPSETAGARWDEIDLEQSLWCIPQERMKKRREHIVPLTSQALRILERMRLISGRSDFIFPSDRTNKKSYNPQSANMALKRMGFHGKLVSHGLRALASTTLNEAGFDGDIIEAALAHVDSNSVRAAYNRAQYIERRKVMMEWWSQRIETASLTGEISPVIFGNI
ncbi:integrase domain-containing protein [Porticoccaceae bacterium]|nr:integrase domain-containing protein [Porticoccaceae bacterium]